MRIGLEHPYDATRAIGVVELRDGAMCASAVNRRVWGEGLHHVLDARTGLPVRTWAATWAEFSFGKLTLPVGLYASHMISDPLQIEDHVGGGEQLRLKQAVEPLRRAEEEAALQLENDR